MRRSRNHSPEPDASDDDGVALHHRKPFGAGLKRQRVEFVRAQDADVSILPGSTSTADGSHAGDIYASIVMSGAKQKKEDPETPTEPEGEGNKVQICPVCSLPITTPVEKHEATLAHQVSLAHSHPPSALDRSRMGLRTLASSGWDPDARVGLGAEGEGMRFPIKVTAKEDTLGVGATAATPPPPKEEKPRALSARERKELERKEKRKGEHLQREIFGSVDVERYLRGETGGATGSK